MKRLNQAGRDAIEEFIMHYHKDAIYMDSFISEYYQWAENRKGSDFNIILLYGGETNNGICNHLLLKDHWFDDIESGDDGYFDLSKYEIRNGCAMGGINDEVPDDEGNRHYNDIEFAKQVRETYLRKNKLEEKPAEDDKINPELLTKRISEW